MRTNSSSFGSSIGFDDVVPSSSGTTISDCPEFRKTLKQYGKFFSTRLIQAVVQSRTNERFDLACVVPPATPDWFNMCIDELGEVSAQIKRSITRFPPAAPSMSIDFILYTCEGDLLPMESWTFSVDEEDQQGSWTNDVKSLLYHQLGVLLRSSMVAARMTPLHRYYVKKQSADTFIILYKLCEGQSTIELGSDAKRMELGRFPTPIGAFKLELAYRTQMEVERALTPEVGESLNQMSIIFSGTPDLGNVGSPTPSSYCELMSEFSTSPTSVVAASPVDALSEQIVRPGRIRSTSLASDGEQPSGSPKFKSYSSCQHISLNIPFANLLTVSHTGYLYPLPEEIEKRRKLKTDVSSLIPMIPRTLEAQEITAKPDETSSKDFLMNFVSSCNASNEDHVEPQKIEKLQMLVPTKDEIIRYPDLAHSQRTVVNEDSMKGDEIKVNSVITQDDGDDLDRTVTPTNESNASDEDSFVKIPFFGPSNLDPGERSETLRSIDRHLGEFISSVKTPAQLGLSVDWSEFRDIETQLGNFSKQQGIFDKFVAEVRECGQSD